MDYEHWDLAHSNARVSGMSIVKVGHLAECPWHRGPGPVTDSNSLRVVQMICEKEDNTFGYPFSRRFGSSSGRRKFLDFSCVYSAANFDFFCWWLGLIPGGAPFSQLSSGVKTLWSDSPGW